MSIDNPYTLLDFSESEFALYKLLLRIAKTPKANTSNNLHKVKVTDLVEVSRYSKPKVYEIIKSLAEKNLIRIDNTRPMHIQPIDPEFAIKKILKRKQVSIKNSATKVLEELAVLPHIELDYPFQSTPPFSFFANDKQYYDYLEEMLNKAKEEVIMIIGFIVRVEESLLKRIFAEKIKQGVNLRILYGGSQKKLGHLMFSFERNYLEPIKDLVEDHKDTLFLDGAIYAPALRITIIDNKELLMVVKNFDKNDERFHINNVSGIYSDHIDLIRTASDAYFMLRPISDWKLIKEKLKK